MEEPIITTTPSKLEEIEIDWKEAFFMLAVLVSRADWDEAKKFIDKVMKTPRYTVK